MNILQRSRLFILILMLKMALCCLSLELAADEVVLSDKEKVLGVFCDKLNAKFKGYYWNRIICNPKTWEWDEQYTTPGGNPLIYRVFEGKSPKSTTLVMCTIHGDELPSLYQCVHLVRDILFDNPKDYFESKVIIAPIINPDGFLLSKPTRQNGRGVDLNRNFPTKDFAKKALKEWKRRYSSTKRKYPGKKGGSEIETRFQMEMIARFKPDKIISIHSPLGWLDVDTPDKSFYGDEPDGFQFAEFSRKSKDIAMIMSKKSNNFKLISFRVYPGSLGNYAANERGIPTYTLELENSDPHRAHRFWLKMRNGIVAAIQYRLKSRINHHPIN